MLIHLLKKFSLKMVNGFLEHPNPSMVLMFLYVLMDHGIIVVESVDLLLLVGSGKRLRYVVSMVKLLLALVHMLGVTSTPEMS